MSTPATDPETDPGNGIGTVHDPHNLQIDETDEEGD